MACWLMAARIAGAADSPVVQVDLSISSDCSRIATCFDGKLVAWCNGNEICIVRADTGVEVRAIEVLPDE